MFVCLCLQKQRKPLHASLLSRRMSTSAWTTTTSASGLPTLESCGARSRPSSSASQNKDGGSFVSPPDSTVASPAQDASRLRRIDEASDVSAMPKSHSLTSMTSSLSNASSATSVEHKRHTKGSSERRSDVINRSSVEKSAKTSSRDADDAKKASATSTSDQQSRKGSSGSDVTDGSHNQPDSTAQMQVILSTNECAN